MPPAYLKTDSLPTGSVWLKRIKKRLCGFEDGNVSKGYRDFVSSKENISLTGIALEVTYPKGVKSKFAVDSSAQNAKVYNLTGRHPAESLVKTSHRHNS